MSIVLLPVCIDIERDRVIEVIKKNSSLRYAIVGDKFNSFVQHRPIFALLFSAHKHRLQPSVHGYFSIISIRNLCKASISTLILQKETLNGGVHKNFGQLTYYT